MMSKYKEVDKKNKHKMMRTVVLFVGVALACFVLSNYSVPRSYMLSQVSDRNTTAVAAADFEPEIPLGDGGSDAAAIVSYKGPDFEPPQTVSSDNGPDSEPQSVSSGKGHDLEPPQTISSDKSPDSEPHTVPSDKGPDFEPPQTVSSDKGPDSEPQTVSSGKSHDLEPPQTISSDKRPDSEPHTVPSDKGPDSEPQTAPSDKGPDMEPPHSKGIVKTQLDVILENASTNDKNVIVTNLNDAWVEPHSIFDLFLESFHIGNNTRRLVNHLVVVCVDEKAYNRCSALHPHCYHLRIEGLNSAGEAFFMSPNYLEIVWKKIDFLATILEKGYNFVFTDTDIMWLRDPFPHFDPEADFQTSCDMFFGNSSSINNLPNTGFNYVKSNNRTVQFLKFWYNSRKTYPNLHDQDVFKKIVNDSFTTEIGVRLGFLNTAYFGGFCEPSKDFNLVCTMHANCCVGLKKKVHDLQTLLEDWRRFMSFDPSMKPNPSWSVPRDCRSLSSRTSSQQGNSTMKNSEKGNRR